MAQHIIKEDTDILEAYHVDPRFEERRKGITIRKPDMESVSEGSKKLAGKIGGWLAGMKDSIHHMWEAMRRGWRAFRGTCLLYTSRCV